MLTSTIFLISNIGNEDLKNKPKSEVLCFQNKN